ncbi:hypothetical protein [Kutzneria sp. CA-103260]|uniref:hypothetical protein n=1 Tax=Kutzneria sp. CA-103260 TaxID=2802641 RepID=UPI001BAC5AA7|nr:hypothetical protein [Kutzneria sp. CA-103260]QUQ69094.1 hypothetical protein JJ691_68480 [Kutzneria sp. CA-103260]
MDDPEVVAALRPFARAATQLLAVLTEPDPFRLHGRAIGAVANIDGVDPKYLARLGSLPDELSHRVAALVPLLVASTGVDRRALGLAAEALVVCAEADTLELRVRVLAAVLYDRDVNAASVGGDEDGQTAWLLAELAEATRRHGRVTVRALAVTIQRLGDLLATIDGRARPLIGGRLGLWRLRSRARRWIREQSAVRWDPRGRQS